MIKLRHILRILISLLVCIQANNAGAQTDRLIRAGNLYQSKQIEFAQQAIDSVVVHPETSKDFISWSTRAFIYFELYKKLEKNQIESPLRDTVVVSLKRSYALNPDNTYRENNNKLTSVMSVSYYNIAVKLLQVKNDYEGSQNAFEKSKELAHLFKPDSNFKHADVDFYNTVGAIFSEKFNNDNTDAQAQDIAKSALLKVIDADKNNERANYNLGIMYYNQAVKLVKSLDFGADISEVDVIQESITKLAKQSEQLINVVYQNNKSNKNSLEALFYISKMLNDPEKIETYKKKCLEAGIKIEAE